MEDILISIHDNKEITFRFDPTTMSGEAYIVWYDHHSEIVETMTLSLDVTYDMDGRVYLDDVLDYGDYNGVHNDVARIIEEYDSIGYSEEIEGDYIEC